MISDVKVGDRILLTGAGFTKNFGGFLAAEMWSLIFNNPNVQRSSKLRTLLQNNFDFESAYSSVLDDPHANQADQEQMRIAVLEAYAVLDDAIRGWVFNHVDNVVSGLIIRYAGTLCGGLRASRFRVPSST